jgi:DNA-binding response OmpR family regulator
MAKKVLLVEDDRLLSLALTSRLNAMGYQPIPVSSIAEAMSTVVSRKPDISLIDINLPDGTGFTLAKQIQNNPNVAKIPLIFISASSCIEYMERSKAYSDAPLIKKPFDAETLADYLALFNGDT